MLEDRNAVGGGMGPSHSGRDLSSMNLQETLACFGAVFGLALVVYLFCRCCRAMDPVSNQDGLLEGRYDAGRYRYLRTWNAHDEPVRIPIPAPSAEPIAEGDYVNYGTIRP